MRLLGPARGLLGTWAALALVGAAGCSVSTASPPTRAASSPHAPSTATGDVGPTNDEAEEPDARAPSDEPEPVFRGRIKKIGPDLRPTVVGRNWRPGCPVPLRDLRVLHAEYWGFDGEVHTGPLILNERVVDDVRSVFRRLFRARFPIKHIALARKYRPNADRYDDTRDVTSSFNCRPVTDGTSLSQHSYGWAIDVNPIENPYVRSDGSVLRRAAKPYRDRSLDEPGTIHAGDLVVRSFARIGWGWGGAWSSVKDYMHFSSTGR